MPDLYYSDSSVTLYCGRMEDVLPSLGEFDAAICDPPYGETSLAWDRWPDGWPALVAQHTRSMWCFGSMRMFLDRRDEFAGWRLSQHPTEKPSEVIAPLVEYSVPPGGLVLDVFAGSCSTLLTARQLGRRAVGIEADESMCEKAVRLRLSIPDLFEGGVA